MNAPGSPSSALQTTYLSGASAAATIPHLTPVGNPPPPRPRSPLALIVSTTSPGVSSVSTFARAR